LEGSAIFRKAQPLSFSKGKYLFLVYSISVSLMIMSSLL